MTDARGLPDRAKGRAAGRDETAPGLLMTLAIGIAYFVTAQVSLELALVDENVTPIWPPTGIAVAALFIFGRRAWPGIAVAAFAVNVPINDDVWAAATTAVGNTVAPLVAVALMERVDLHRSLDRLTDAVTVVWTALVAMTISATVGSMTLLAEGAITSGELAATWSVWWTGDTMGVLVVAPFLFVLPDLWRVLRSRWRDRLELAAHVLAVIAVSVLVMSWSMSLLFLALLPVSIAAWRFQQAGATPSALLASSIAAFAAAHALGPFAVPVLERMLTLQAFNASIALGSFVFAALVTERIARREELEALNRSLEERVVDRTAELWRANERLAEEVRERADAEQALRSGERALAEAQAIARIGSWTWDLDTSEVTWSDQMYAIHGLAPDGTSVTFERAMSYIVDEDVGRVRANVQAALGAGRAEVPSIAYRITRSDGTIAQVLGAARIESVDGQAVRMIGTVQDLTERLEREREHRIADELQRTLLPRELPLVSGVELAARYVPAESDLLAGGDWYDALPLPDGKLAVVIGDVAGHGLEAASLMGQVRMAVRAALASATDPGAAITSVDRVLQRVGPTAISTVLLAVVDRQGGTISYASAGHLPPAALERGTARYFPITGDPPLGAVREGVFRTVIEPFAAGSTIVLFTDGLVDRRGADLRTELERVLVAAAEADPDDLTSLADGMLSIVPGEPADDVAILCIRATSDAIPPLRIDLPARPQELSGLRRELRTWLDDAGVAARDADDLVLACHEAATNAIEHARPEDGRIQVAATLVGDRVEIDVVDAGTWREPRASSRGRGLSLIRAVSSSFELDTGAGGTHVSIGRTIERAS